MIPRKGNLYLSSGRMQIDKSLYKSTLNRDTPCVIAVFLNAYLMDLGKHNIDTECLCSCSTISIEDSQSQLIQCAYMYTHSQNWVES